MRTRAMSHHLESAAAMLVRSGDLVKQLLILSVLPTALIGCALSTSRDVRAYETCAARHPQELEVCEGPRQAYELNPAAFEARAGAIGSLGDSRYEEPAPAVHPSLAAVPLHPSSIAPGRNGVGVLD